MTWDNNVTVTLHNDSTESFYTGDIVTGIITLDLEKDLKVESEYIPRQSLNNHLHLRIITSEICTVAGINP